MMYRQRDVRVVNGFADSMIRDITNYRISYAESGAVSAEYEYDPFGKVIAHTGRDFDFLFSTKFYDPDIGMYYYGYRYYSPELRRWASRDPIGEEGGLNLYGFCRNEGITAFDPLGLSTFVLIYDSSDPMFQTWVEDLYRRILSHTPTRYGSTVEFNSEKDNIVKVPITGTYVFDNLQHYKEVKYLASFGHGRAGKIWWGYNQGDEVYSVVTGMVGYRVNKPEVTTSVPLSKLLLDFDKCGFTVEFYHCVSAEKFEVDDNGKLQFRDLEIKVPIPANFRSKRHGSVISAFRDMVMPKYPQTKFSVVGSERGVSDGYPLNRGWPRPQGKVGRLEVSP